MDKKKNATGVEELHKKQDAKEKAIENRSRHNSALEEAYTAHILPKLNELNNLCRELNFPYRFYLESELIRTDMAPDSNPDGKPFTVYDKTHDFTKHGAVLVKQLREFCVINRIPYYMTFATKNDASGTKYVSSAAVGAFGLQLKDELITRHLLAGRGANVIPAPAGVLAPDEALAKALDGLVEDSKPIISDSGEALEKQRVSTGSRWFEIDESPLDLKAIPSADDHPPVDAKRS